nr:hypothetical protein GCM10020241_36140 [Streptoalloteichus tenebrarius]
MALGVGAGLGAEFVGATGGDALGVGVGADDLVGVITAGVDEGLGHVGAVPDAFDLEGAGVFGLGTELVAAVGEEDLEAEGAGGQLEVLGAAVVVGAVGGQQPVGRPARGGAIRPSTSWVVPETTRALERRLRESALRRISRRQGLSARRRHTRFLGTARPPWDTRETVEFR